VTTRALTAVVEQILARRYVAALRKRWKLQWHTLCAHLWLPYSCWPLVCQLGGASHVPQNEACSLRPASRHHRTEDLATSLDLAGGSPSHDVRCFAETRLERQPAVHDAKLLLHLFTVFCAAEATSRGKAIRQRKQHPQRR